MKLKFVTFELDGTNRVSFSQEEVLFMINSIDKDNPYMQALIEFLEHLEHEVIKV